MKFNFLETFMSEGVRETSTPGYLEDDRFYYRISGNDVQVAVRNGFDRWANSTDFVFAIPKTPKGWEKTKARLDKAAKQHKKGDLGEGTRI